MQTVGNNAGNAIIDPKQYGSAGEYFSTFVNLEVDAAVSIVISNSSKNVKVQHCVSIVVKTLCGFQL